jgi:NodT family efflux transporter outer membrane factor (OMF) lipoprotein
MLKINKILFGLILLLIVAACKTPQKATQTDTGLTLPESYTNQSDTINSGDLNWQSYFQDDNLKSLIQSAITNNFDVLSAVQKIEIAQNQFNLRQSQLLPNANVVAGAAQRKFGLFTMDGAGNASTNILPNQVVPEHLRDFQIGLSTSWEADVWGKLKNSKKAAFARFSGSIAGKNAIQSMLIAEIATNYYELLALDNEFDIINENIQIQKASLEIIKIKKEAGILNELAVKQFEGQVLNSRSFVLDLEQKIKVLENHLNFLCGRFPQPIIREKAQFNIMQRKLTAGIPSQLLKLRPDIAAVELDLIASKCDVKAAKAAFYPSFTITGNIGFQAFQSALLFQTPESFAYTILGGLTAPLLNRRAIKVQFNTAKVNQVEHLLKYQKTILNGYIEVANELSNIENLQKIYDLQNQEVYFYEKSVETANDLFRSGRATYLEVLTVQRTVLESKIDLLNTKKFQHQASVKLYKSLGGGWK